MGSMIMLSRAARGDDPPRAAASFQPGDLVHHKRYGYRGVVVAVDPNCRADDAWYQANQTQPDRDQPWYHVLVHGSVTTTYPAQESLEPDLAGGRVAHPLVALFFSEFREGRYVRNDEPWEG